MKKATHNESIYQLKVTLEGIKPPIWRRLLVPASITLDVMHDIVQLAFGWEDSHLHLFEVNGVEYSEPDPNSDELGQKDEVTLPLSKALPREGSKIRYVYDYGDDWTHTILLEKILPREEGKVYPICVTGKRAGPPEDVGGVWGYAGFLKAIADPKHEGHDEYLEWIGGSFDPEEFFVDDVNDELKELEL